MVKRYSLMLFAASFAFFLAHFRFNLIVCLCLGVRARVYRLGRFSITFTPLTVYCAVLCVAHTLYIPIYCYFLLACLSVCLSLFSGFLDFLTEKKKQSLDRYVNFSQRAYA